MSTQIESLHLSEEQNKNRIAIETSLNIMKSWNLKTSEIMTLLGLEPSNRTTFFKWKRDPQNARLSNDTYERISYIFGIYKALQILLPQAEAADSWIHKPNNAPLFDGSSALNRMLSGKLIDLYHVREYLDAQRG